MNKNMYLKILFTSLVIGLHAGSEELNNITKPCQPGGGMFTAFPGLYTLKMNIDGIEFLDQLVISSTSRHPGMINFKEIFQGTFTVPDVFTTEVEDGLLQYGMWSDRLYLSFKITATENGISFPVYFEALGERQDQACLMTGKAYSPTRDKEMTFTMTKDTDDCICKP